MSEDIAVYFILPKDCDNEERASKIMQEAFALYQQHSADVKWIPETDCSTVKFQKNDIVVLDTFDGQAFKSLSNEKCLRIIGPWCLITSLTEKIEIPNNGSAVYNLSMVGLVITLTNFPPEVKVKLRRKILLMGGIVSLHVTNKVTHLISNSVTSAKYVVAQEQGIPVLLVSWVEDVWTASLDRRVNATDSEFIEKHKCATFQNLLVSATGLSERERATLKSLMENNSGSFSGKMNIGKTHMLICKQGTTSEKLIMARKFKLPCVTLQWVLDSVDKGYALPEHDYQLHARASTPNMLDIPNPDFSNASSISTVDHSTPSGLFRREFLETMNVTNLSDFNSTLVVKVPPNLDVGAGPLQLQQQQTPTSTEKLVDSIDLRQVKLAGLFLDGCIVYLVGFEGKQREKICRILKSGGATRYDDISDRITHVIVGDGKACELKQFVNGGCDAMFVTVQWLAESVRLQQLASEDTYRFQRKGFGSSAAERIVSPLGKKGLDLLSKDLSVVESERRKGISAVSLTADVDQRETEVMSLYLQKNTDNTQADAEDTLARLLAYQNVDSKMDGGCHDQKDGSNPSHLEEDATVTDVFAGKTFHVLHFDVEEQTQVLSMIEELGGEVKDTKFKGITDYLVVPAIMKQTHHTSAEVVTNLWIVDCHERNALVDMKFHHSPICMSSNSRPLRECVVTVSGYPKSERLYLGKIIELLGGIYQEKFARVTLTDHSLLACTHLVCSEPSGSKYQAALRWSVPIVNCNWVLEAAERDSRLSEKQYSLERTMAVTTTNSGTTAISSSNINTNTEHVYKRQKLETDNAAAKTVTPDLSKVTISEDAANDNISNMKIQEYIASLRNKGLFDPPSPAPACQSPSVVNHMREEAILKGLVDVRSTPDRRVQDTSIGCSQDTPVATYIKGLQRRKILPSEGSPRAGRSSDHNTTPQQHLLHNSQDIPTPDTPLGRFLGGGDPSPNTKKHWQRYLNRLPTHDIRQSTPMSEVKRKIWERFLSPNTIQNLDEKYGESQEVGGLCSLDTSSQEVTDTQKANEEKVSDNLLKLQEMMKRRDSIGGKGGRRLTTTVSNNTPHRHRPRSPQQKGKDSQSDTVGWEDPTEARAHAAAAIHH